MTRDNAPDLLASMFGPTPEEEAPARPHPPPPARQPASNRPAPAYKPEPVPQPAPPAPPPPDPPIRCTHYLSRETAGRLPIAQGHLLMMTALQKRDVSNSAVVEAALRLAFAELEARGGQSRLVTILQEMAAESGAA